MAYPAYEWDERLARYRNAATGRVVSVADVRRSLDRAIRAEGQRARDLAEQVRIRAITTREWEQGMREVIKNVQLFSAASAKGGWAQLDQRAYGQVGQAVREQYGYLQQFTDDLKTGLVVKDGGFLSRSQSYAGSGIKLYHEVERDVQREVGYTEERSVLHPADHCVGCVVERDKGWQPIGTMVAIGERDCLGNCVCSVAYR